MKITRISTSAWIEARTDNKMQLQGDYYGPLKKEKRKKLIKVIIIIVAKGSCLFLINTIILQILKISVMIVVVFGFSFVHQIKKIQSRTTQPMSHDPSDIQSTHEQ